MLSTSITIPSALSERIARYQRNQPLVKEQLSQAVRSSAIQVKVEAQRRVPVSTGALLRSIDVTLFASGLAAVIGSYLPYAAKWEYSTVPHPVKPSLRRSRNTKAGRKGSIIKGTGQINPNAEWGYLRKSLAKEKSNFLLKIMDIARRFK